MVTVAPDCAVSGEIGVTVGFGTTGGVGLLFLLLHDTTKASIKNYL
jgi:hypothetical protein